MKSQEQMDTGTIGWVADDRGIASLEFDNPWYGITRIHITVEPYAFKEGDRVKFHLCGGRCRPNITSRPVKMEGSA